MLKAKRKNRVELYLLAILLVIIFVLLTTIRTSNKIDDQTIAVCRWYAEQDHSGEIGVERNEKMGYLWKNFDWYESCINNVKR